MKLLFIGDIFGHAGRRIVADHVADIRSSQAIDVVIANCENSAAGFGVTPNVADELFRLGIDVMTSGNHIWDKRDIYDYLGRTPRLLRPANYPPGVPGSGVYIHTTASGARCAVMNLQGRVYMPQTDCPFRKADELLAALPADVKVRFIDFHAEVTSEKMAMGWYLDGRVSAIIGTHTHIPTADTRILPQRHGLSDRLRDDRTVRFGHRRGERAGADEVPDRDADQDGAIETGGGAALRHCGCGRRYRQGDFHPASHRGRRLILTHP